MTDGQAGVGIEEVQVTGIKRQVKPLSSFDMTARRDACRTLRFPAGQGNGRVALFIGDRPAEAGVLDDRGVDSEYDVDLAAEFLGDVGLHEAARVDGADPWQVFWRITYPLLKPIFLVLLLSVIWDFGVFTQAYLITGALGNRDEYNLGIYAYAKAFQLPPSYGLGGALAVILTIILLVITVGYVRASVRQGATA
jgi:hypothetical protein